MERRRTVNDGTLSLRIPYPYRDPDPRAMCAMINSMRVLVSTALLLVFSMDTCDDNILSLMALEKRASMHGSYTLVAMHICHTFLNVSI